MERVNDMNQISYYNILATNNLISKLDYVFGDTWHKKDIVLFGAGSGADLVLERYNTLDIKYFVDNDSKKWGKKKNGLIIKSPVEIPKENDDILILIVSMYYLDISKQLTKYGFEKNKHYMFGLYPDVINEEDYMKMKTNNVIYKTNDEVKKGEIIVYLLDETMLEDSLHDFIVEWLERHGLSMVYIKSLDINQQQRICESAYFNNDIKPTYMIVAYDYHPIRIKRGKEDSQYPTNVHYYMKDKLIGTMNMYLSNDYYKGIVCSKSERIAWQWVNTIELREIDDIRDKLKKIEESYYTNEEALLRLGGKSANAKVELIRYKNNLAVRKTYRYRKKRFCERERYVYSELSKRNKNIPPLLASGENYIIIPWYDEDSNAEFNKIIKCHEYQIIETMKFFYEEGFALIDFHPGNIIFTKDGKFVIIDFEYLHTYDKKPKSFEDSYDIQGVPLDFSGDWCHMGMDKTYNTTWKPILCRSIDKYIKEIDMQ